MMLLSLLDLLNMIGQFSRDVIGCKTNVKFVISHWSISIRLLFVGRSVCRCVYVVCKMTVVVDIC